MLQRVLLVIATLLAAISAAQHDRMPPLPTPTAAPQFAPAQPAADSAAAYPGPPTATTPEPYAGPVNEAGTPVPSATPITLPTTAPTTAARPTPWPTLAYPVLGPPGGLPSADPTP